LLYIFSLCVCSLPMGIQDLISYLSDGSGGHPSGVTITAFNINHRFGFYLRSRLPYNVAYLRLTLLLSQLIESASFFLFRTTQHTITKNPSLPAKCLIPRHTNSRQQVRRNTDMGYWRWLTWMEYHRSDPQLSTMSHTLPQADHVRTRSHTRRFASQVCKQWLVIAMGLALRQGPKIGEMARSLSLGNLQDTC
jgi:hypothetical protein